MPYQPKNRPFFLKRRKADRPSVHQRVPFLGAVDTHAASARSRRIRKVLKVLGILIALGFVAGILGMALLFAWVSRDLPNPDKLLTRQVEKTTKIWDRTGTHLLYEIHGDQKRTLVELDQIAPVAVKEAIVSEDKNFYEHKGVELKSLFRALLQSFRRGRVEGTSTITQQLVKNAILTNVRTGFEGISRKAKELILSYQIERTFTKDQILKMYFNEIPYGSIAYGIEAASQTYLGKSAKDLDPAEGALLAALNKAPSRLSPYGSHTDELLWWQRFILDEMGRQGYMTQEEVDAAKNEDILARVKPRRDSLEAPHFSLYVKELLSETYGEKEVESGGLNVITTLDYDKQKEAEQAVTDGMEVVQKFGGSNAALVSMDPKTGQVLAMVGSADYFNEEIGGAVNVTLRQRQPGSSFKPIVYTAAIEKGYTPDTVLFDVNTSFPTDSGKPYEPRDYDLGERGPVTLKKALAGSLNIPAVKTLYLVGVDNALDFAEKLGYTTLKDRSRFGLSLVLGGAEVKPVEHAAAFSTFAAEGTYRAPAYILKVDDASGQTLEEWKDDPKADVVSVQAARSIATMMSDNEARAYIFGEKNYLTLPDRPVAAKTGTTNGFHDAWTVGFTPNLTTVVWVGNNDNSEMKKNADGSRVAAPIWQQYMKAATADMPIEAFTPPDPIVTGKSVLDGQAGEIRVKIDKFSGKLATENTPPTAVEERVYRQAHSILQYVDKNDPRGPYPTDPSSDPQYAAWEAGVADWAQRNGWVTTEAPPTETDDVHTGADAPSVTFVAPSDNATIGTRSLYARVQAEGPRGVKRVEYSLDGALLATATAAPWDATLTLPGTFGPGFYTLRATAYDEIETSGSQDIVLNVTSQGVPLTFSWSRPSADITYRQGAFPIYIDTVMNQHLGVSYVEILAAPIVSGDAPAPAPILIGTLTRPKTDGVSVSWSSAPDPGAYRLKAIVHLPNDETKEFEGPKITVKP